jgi:hypothetical protein
MLQFPARSLPVDTPPWIVKACNCSAKADQPLGQTTPDPTVTQSRLSCPQIAMMQSANLRQRNDSAFCRRLDLSSHWCIHFPTIDATVLHYSRQSTFVASISTTGSKAIPRGQCQRTVSGLPRESNPALNKTQIGVTIRCLLNNARSA